MGQGMDVSVDTKIVGYIWQDLADCDLASRRNVPEAWTCLGLAWWYDACMLGSIFVDLPLSLNPESMLEKSLHKCGESYQEALRMRKSTYEVHNQDITRVAAVQVKQLNDKSLVDTIPLSRIRSQPWPPLIHRPAR